MQSLIMQQLYWKCSHVDVFKFSSTIAIQTKEVFYLPTYFVYEYVENEL
jgi:hypothetical protein